jgi:hypothetical protein
MYRGVQFRIGVLCAYCFQEYSMEDIHYFRYLLHRSICSSVLYVPRDTSKPLEELGRSVYGRNLAIDILFEEHIPAWKTHAGSSTDERAASIAQQRQSFRGGKREFDATLQHEENLEKAKAREVERAASDTSQKGENVENENVTGVAGGPSEV